MAQLEPQYVILIVLFVILFSVPVMRLIYRKYIVSAAAAIHDKVDAWQRLMQARMSDAGKKFSARLAASSKRLRR